MQIHFTKGDLTMELWDLLKRDGSCEIYILGLDLDQILIDRAIEKNKDLSHIHFVRCNVMEEEELNHAIAQFFQRIHSEGFAISIVLIFGGPFDLLTCFSTTMWIRIFS